MREVIVAEIKERGAFLKAYGEVIPLDFLPQLKILPTRLPCIDHIINTDESKLPHICDWVPQDFL
jgi:hypothetical protein